MAKPTVRTAGEARRAREALAELQDVHLECRDMRHAWNKRRAVYYFVGSEIHRWTFCRDCHAEKTDRWTRDGKQRLRSWYSNYPVGYLIKGVRVTGVEVRREVIGRVKIYESYEAMKVGELRRKK